MEARTATAPGWMHYPHDADIGVRGFGAGPEEAFANTARALTDAVTPLDGVAADRAVPVTCEAPDLELLLVDWLNAVIYAMATSDMLFSEFRLRIEGGKLAGELVGEPLDVARHAPAVEPKGATLTDLSVARGPDGRWVAQCVVDV